MLLFLTTMTIMKTNAISYMKHLNTIKVQFQLYIYIFEFIYSSSSSSPTLYNNLTIAAEPFPDMTWVWGGVCVCLQSPLKLNFKFELDIFTGSVWHRLSSSQEYLTSTFNHKVGGADITSVMRPGRLSACQGGLKSFIMFHCVTTLLTVACVCLSLLCSIPLLLLELFEIKHFIRSH